MRAPLHGRARHVWSRAASAVVALAFCAGGCLCARPLTPAEGVIRVSGDGWRFENADDGAPFVPAGVNYDHDLTTPCPLLLEEYWGDDFARVEGDLDEMAALGFNVVRVHLQLGAFLDGPGDGEQNTANLERLDRLVDAARDRGLRLLLTGLGLYRREQIPAWYAELALDDDASMAVEASFWRAIAARYPGHPGVLGYDLQNEPFVQNADTDELVTDPFAPCDPDGDGPEPARGFSFVHLKFRHAQTRYTQSSTSAMPMRLRSPRRGPTTRQAARPSTRSRAPRSARPSNASSTISPSATRWPRCGSRRWRAPCARSTTRTS